MATARGYVIHAQWAFLQHAKPVGPRRDSPEDNGIFLGIKPGVEIVAGRRRRQRGWHGEATLGIECHDHGGIIPQAVRFVKVAGVALNAP